MTEPTTTTAVVPPRPPSGADVCAPASAVFLPKEHGSWSLALEPLALGLLLAPSYAGAALATAAVAGFFARRPLKALLQPGADRGRSALPALLLLATLASAALVESALLGGPVALWPLLLAVPFGALFVYFDAQNEARAAIAELAGCATFAFLPVAMATLAGWPVPAALALLVLALTRSLPTVLTVRTYLRLQKRPPPVTLSHNDAFALGGTWPPDRYSPASVAPTRPEAGFHPLMRNFEGSLTPPALVPRRDQRSRPTISTASLRLGPILAGAAAVGLTALLARQQLVPWLAVGLAGFMLVRTLWFLSPLRPILPAKQIGMIEAVIGVLYLGGLALAYRA